MSKGLPELLEEEYKPEGCETEEKKFENVHKGLLQKNKCKAHLNQEHQKNHKDDPLGEAIDSVLDLSSTNAKNITFLATILAHRDNAPQVIRSLGLSEIKGDTLKSIIDQFKTKDYNIDGVTYRIANSGAIQTSRSATYANRRCDDYLTYFRNACTEILYNNASGGLLGDFLKVHHTSKKNNQEGDSLYACLLVAMGDEGGGGDPEQTKLINSIPLGKSSLPTSVARYLMELKAREIHTEVVQKECNSVDFSKTTNSSLDKLSWRENCEENTVDRDVPTSDEEEDDVLLALANLLYCKEETDDMLDIIYSLEDDVAQQFFDTQTVDDREVQANDDDDNDDDSVADDSGSEAPDNDRSEDINTPLQAAYKVVIIEVESNSYSGIHELAGTDQTNPTTDYWARQSQLVGTQSHQSTKSEAHETKHHILITNGSSISMTTEEVYTTNLTVNTTFQNLFVSMPQGQLGYSHPLHDENGLSNEEEESGAVEQAPELTLVYPQYEHVVLSPPITTQDLLLQFPQAEDQPAPLSNEAESSTEDLPEDAYIDAVEAQPEESEEDEGCQSSSFVSASAENVDDEAEAVHYAKRRQWLDCCLL